MLSASVIGPATSLSAMIHDRENSQKASCLKFHKPVQPISGASNGIRRSGDADDGEEELAWWGRRVVWSRGGELYRQWSFEGDEDEVAWAGFVWFPPTGSAQRAGNPSTTHHGSNKEPDPTFGPFHTSQSSSWGMPAGLLPATTETSRVRTVLILLAAQGLVYYPTGEVKSFHLPMPVSWAFPLSSSDGGVLFQRKLKTKEQENLGSRAGVLHGLNRKRTRRSSGHGMSSVLDDVRDLDRGADLPKLYTLSDPFDELRMVVEARIYNDRLVGPEEPIDSGVSVLFLSSDSHPYPFIVLVDRVTSEVVFCRRCTVPLKATPPPATTPRLMRPEDILKQGTPSIGLGTGRIRPIMHRTTSGYSATGERAASATSAMLVDPMDRARRSSRMSKVGSAGMEGLPGASTGDLQAALDPPMLPTQSSNITTRSKEKSKARESPGPTRVSSAAGLGGLDDGRRQSGASSFMREDPDAGKGDAGVPLHAIGDRDLRETTMMMGIERNEDTIRSEVVLERIWVWKPPEIIDPEHTKVFISDNVSPDMANINIVTPSALHIFRADKPSSSRWTFFPLKSIPCASAVPVIATRRNVLDTLVLSDGELSVITADGDLPLALPSTGGDKELPRKLASSLSMRMDEDMSMASMVPGSTPKSLEDSVGGRVTVVFQDGDRIRMSVDCTVHDELVRQCLEAVAWVLSGAETFALKRDILLGIQNLPSAQRMDKHAVWTVFEKCILRLGGRTRGSPSLSNREALVQSASTSSDPITRRLAAKIAQRPSMKMFQTPASPGLPTEDISRILLALHLVAQDRRLRSVDRIAFERVGSLVLSLAETVRDSDWYDYWRRILPQSSVSLAGGQLVLTETLKSPGGHSANAVLQAYDSPPDILAYLSRRLVTPLRPFSTPKTLGLVPVTEFGDADPCQLTITVNRIYDLCGYSPLESRTSIGAVLSRAAACVKFMVDRHLDLEWLHELSFAVSLPILEMIRVCQASPQRTWPEAMYTFVGRADLAAQVAPDWDPNLAALEPASEDTPTIADLSKSLAESLKSRGHKPTLPYVRFGSDRRLQEVERIMQTTRLRTIAVQEPKNANDQELVRYQQEVVNTISNRTLAIPVGQGMFEYGTRTATITALWEIPLIELSIKILPAKTTLRAQINAENADWPCFHNGVSAALSISPDCKGIESSWIVFNRPQNLNPEHGGFLLGLGLSGHLKSLMTYHAFPYLEPRHDFTSVGLLLGLSASYAGSEDLLLTKVLSLHTHALLPLGSMDLNASTIIQSSALVGLGLVYAGKKNLRMAEVALGEIGRKQLPGVDAFGDYQEAYSFSASMAFGLIMLGRGGHVTSEVDRRMLSQIQRCITGDAPTLDGRRGGIDTTLTAPGATLALGLMYLKTGRKDVADSLEIPQSAFALEHVRPDTLLLRTFARALIMWDDILPSMAWIESQLPVFIKHKDHKKTSQLELNTELAYLNVIAGACLAIGLKYAGTATELAHTNLMFFFSVLSKAASGQSMTYEGNIRRTAARQGLNIVTIALAVVMSGTGELNVLRRLRISHGQEGAGVTYGTHMAMHMACGILFLGRGHYTLGNSNLAIAAMAISFFPRFSPSPGDNTAYPQAFRHLWALAVEPRCLMAKDVNSRETVYLPVKIKLKEGAQSRTQSLISPTLIAPLDTITSIEVESPRYWPITYDLATNRDNLIKTRTIKVKRKAGFLDYNSDPKGNRSIFVKAGSMTGFDLHYDLVSAAAPPMISADEVTTLMAAHSGDPVLVSMAKHFGGESDIDKFVRMILLECVSLDKPLVLTVYLAMLLAGETPEAMSQLAMVKAFYAVYERYCTVSGASERKVTLIRPSFVSALDRRLAVAEADGSEAFLTDGTWSDGLARWIATNHVPSWTLLEALRDKVKRGGEDVELRVRAVADAYAASIATQWDATEGVKDEGPRWSLAIVRQAVHAWTRP